MNLLDKKYYNWLQRKQLQLFRKLFNLKMFGSRVEIIQWLVNNWWYLYNTELSSLSEPSQDTRKYRGGGLEYVQYMIELTRWIIIHSLSAIYNYRFSEYIENINTPSNKTKTTCFRLFRFPRVLSLSLQSKFLISHPVVVPSD